MDNLPLGAEYNEFAPFNERLKDIDVSFYDEDEDIVEERVEVDIKLWNDFGYNERVSYICEQLHYMGYKYIDIIDFDDF